MGEPDATSSLVELTTVEAHPSSLASESTELERRRRYCPNRPIQPNRFWQAEKSTSMTDTRRWVLQLLRNNRASIFSRYQLGSVVKRSTCITRNLTYVRCRSTCVQPTRYGPSANRRYGLAVISPSRGQRQKLGQKRTLSASGVGRRSPKLCPFYFIPSFVHITG